MSRTFETVIPAQAGKRAAGGEFRGTAVQQNITPRSRQEYGVVSLREKFFNQLDSRLRGDYE